MLNGHTDTVPPYGMDDPYSGAVREGRVYGRGSCDMKAGLAAMMCALVALKRADISLSGDVVFTGVIDEEFKSEGTEAVIQSNLSADYAIVGEPTELSVALGHRGLEWIDIVFEGRAAHSGNQKKALTPYLRLQPLFGRWKSNSCRAWRTGLILWLANQP